jgi:hypothetical protein
VGLSTRGESSSRHYDANPWLNPTRIRADNPWMNP